MTTDQMSTSPPSVVQMSAHRRSKHWCVCGSGFVTERELNEHIYREAVAFVNAPTDVPTFPHRADV